MTRRVAVVAAHHDDGWSEEALLVRRLCGALACSADVELLVAGGPPSGATDGAVRVRRFPSTAVDGRRASALRRALLGPEPEDLPISCSCTDAVRRRAAAALPGAAREALLVAGGGYSDELFRELAASRHDVVVFVGAGSASTYWGMQAVAGRRPCVVVPAAAGDPALWSPAVDEVIDAADRVVVATAFEAGVVRKRAPGLKDDLLHTVGFVLRVNGMARRAPAYGHDGRPTVLVARDWAQPFPLDRLVAWCDALVEDFAPRLAVRLAGPGVQAVPARLRAEFAASRTDVWRWMAHALCLLDPEPRRLLGREVVESMAFGTPVVVPADGGATRLHADAGDGGLWYRSYAELRACVGALLDDGGLRATLGRQAEAYATGELGDPDAFVITVGDAVLGVLG
ncbi:MAG TPA: hypothetical protein VFJ85_13325 [Acidimicrobiales bacterium]|nr:hypothetical protein [Acidimicrobiales bacterium]